MSSLWRFELTRLGYPQPMSNMEYRVVRLSWSPSPGVGGKLPSWGTCTAECFWTVGGTMHRRGAPSQRRGPVSPTHHLLCYLISRPASFQNKCCFQVNWGELKSVLMNIYTTYHAIKQIIYILPKNTGWETALFRSPDELYYCCYVEARSFYKLYTMQTQWSLCISLKNQLNWYKL